MLAPGRSTDARCVAPVDSLSALDLLLQHRPGNVVSRLGHAPLPALSPRTILAGLKRSTAVLVAFPVIRPELVPALLRAARFEEAVIGFSVPLPVIDRAGPERLASLLIDATSEAEHTQPVFLQAGPIPVERADESTQAAIHRCVEAGCTLITLEATALGSDAPEILAPLVAPLREAELALELILPVNGPPPATGPLRRTLDALAAAGCLPDFLRFSPRAVSAGAQLEPDWLQLLRQVTDSYGIALSVQESSGDPLRAIAPWVRGGVGKVDVTGAFLDRALGEEGEAQRDELVERSLAMNVSMGELLSLLAGRLPALSERDSLRLEARAFSDAQDLLRAMRLAGSGRRVIEMLAAGAD